MTDQDNTRRPQRQDYERALRSMDTFLDISVTDLMTLAERAEHFADQRATASRGIARVMSRPVQVVRPQTPMSEAAHLLVTERISGLPVVDDTDRLVGIITEADFLRALGVPAHHPSHNLWQTLEALFSHLTRHADLEGPDDPVAEHMARVVVCAAPEASVQDALALMQRHRVKRLPVCDGGRRVLGMVTRSDLVRIFFDRYRQDPRQTVPRPT